MLCNIIQNAMGQTPEGGYPYPIMLCNITQNSMAQTPGGVPYQVQPGCTLPGGYPAWGVPCKGEYPAGVPCLGYTGRVPPGQVRIGYPAGGYPGRVPPGQVRMGGTLPGGEGYPGRGCTQLGKQKEYSLHG